MCQKSFIPAMAATTAQQTGLSMWLGHEPGQWMGRRRLKTSRNCRRVHQCCETQIVGRQLRKPNVLTASTSVSVDTRER